MLDPSLKKYFVADRDLFDQIMTVRGEVYRELEGRRTQRIILGDKSYFLKQHRGVGWREIVKNILQGRLPVLSAKNEWLAIQHLHALNIPTLTIRGYGCRGVNPAALASFLLTDELTNIISLEDFCKDWKVQPPAPGLKRALITEVARIARLMHQHGINHRDFYICHFLWDTSSSSVSPRLYVIDLHRAQIRTNTPIRWVIKDLAALYFSSKDSGLTSRDLWRFMKVYRQQPLREIFTRELTFWQRVKHRGDKTYQEHGK